MSRRLAVGNIVWLIAFAAMLAVVIGGMWNIRRTALRDFASPAAQADWQAWRAEAQRQAAGEGSVKRRVPVSQEPPMLVLMRDHFGVCLAGAVLFSSALFGSLMLLIRGAMRPVRDSASTPPAPPADEPASRP